MAMACLSMNKTLTFASLTNPNNNNINPKKSQHLDLQQQQRQMKKPHKPTVAEIERAIGAGIMNRDVDPKDLDKIANVVDGLLMNSTINEFEGAIEKKLRETGESLVEVTEKGIRSSGTSLCFGLKINPVVRGPVHITDMGFFVPCGIRNHKATL
ncbi:hypothetical protein ACFE04_030575 [Oxalis oulophora]